MIYIDNYENNNENTNVDFLISQIEFFEDDINDSESFYSNIYKELSDQLKLNNIQIKIDFEKLENLYPKDNVIENIYIPQRCKYFIENQLKILNKFNF